VMNGVPRMLTFRSTVWQAFQRLHPGALSGYEGYTLPDAPAPPGERDVLRTFSTEWGGYGWDEKTYWAYTPDYLYRCMDWLLNLRNHPVRGKLLLEVGIGVGGIADHFARNRECEVIGIDLSLAVDAAHRHFGNNPNLHVVQASVFNPPFRNGTFDLAYSQGALHHTFSPRKAFDSMASLVKPAGAAYVWLYRKESRRGSGLRRIQAFVESLTRPVISRLPAPLQTLALMPAVPMYVVYRNAIAARSRPGAVRYSLRDALHAARDRFTHRFASRHTYDEVAGWFMENGFDRLEFAADREDRSDIDPNFYLNVGILGFRPSGLESGIFADSNTTTKPARWKEITD
ncbi:MAG: class I SAM-dependent methyltransferase, partial [bacterium]